ncbi:MAG: neutral zinc metallopeptidase [Gemmatimonadaceae bacterium]
MKRPISRLSRQFFARARLSVLAGVFGLAGLMPISTAHAAPAALDAVLAAPADATAADVTTRDVAATNEKLRLAFGHMARMWRTELDQIGERFVTPGLARYRGAVRTVCGVMSPGNAAYCPRNNTVYFDELFVAGLAKRASRQLGTDGDMTAVGVIAHEMGHAVAMQLGYISRFPYENEAAADCLAGAFALRADEDGSLEPGDIDESFYGMFTAGDPEPELTGDGRADRRILARAALIGHGTYEQRMANFRHGFDGGPGACLAALR